MLVDLNYEVHRRTFHAIANLPEGLIAWKRQSAESEILGSTSLKSVPAAYLALASLLMLTKDG